MATPTRTIGPLHLEDLEPHRFEDMVRQLVYDFRNWRALEATGRPGSDDGFDARAFETVQSADQPAPGDEDEDEVVAVPADDRVWLIQCKREKSIPPKKLRRYLDSLSGESGKLHGIIFAAACDFSKAARDAFREKTRELGFAEAFLWGKGEIAGGEGHSASSRNLPKRWSVTTAMIKPRPLALSHEQFALVHANARGLRAE